MGLLVLFWMWVENRTASSVISLLGFGSFLFLFGFLFSYNFPGKHKHKQFPEESLKVSRVKLILEPTPFTKYANTPAPLPTSCQSHQEYHYRLGVEGIPVDAFPGRDTAKSHISSPPS